MNSPLNSTLGRDLVNKWPEIEATPSEGRLDLTVPAERIRDVVSHLVENIDDLFPESCFGVDLEDDNYEMIYIFWSRTNRTLIQIRVALHGEQPEIDTVSDIIPGLEWHERETHEMYGINFKGHPDLRLLLLPEELKGKYPLRKRFVTDRSRLAESGLPQPKPRPRPKKEASE